jgi:UDP-N-acetylglucosamine 2-epimerase (non-hydrolysing)
VLITGHRRESFEGGLAAVCEGVAELARAYPGTDFVYPVHLNPSVQAAVRGPLGACPMCTCSSRSTIRRRSGCCAAACS